MDLKNQKIAVLMGGFSSEREISLKSGNNVLSILQKGGYHAIGLDVQENFLDCLKKEKVDIAFNVLHGEFGEDGKVQSILDFLKIPYTGSGFEASSIGINKILSKQMVGLYHVPSAPFFITSNNRPIDTHHLPFPFPWIFKPISEGSSLGIKLIKNPEDLKNCLSCKGFIEQFIKGDEVTVGVLDTGEEQTVLPVLQLVPKNEFYDFEAKYTKGMTEFIIPANLPLETIKKVQDMALKAHQAIGALGASRSDFMIDKKGNPYFLEINTNPGMTQTSDIPAQALAHGISHLELCEKILLSAKRRML